MGNLIELPPGVDGVEAAGEAPWNRTILVDIPEIGIEFKEFYTKTYYRFICWWHNARDEHVYELTVRPWIKDRQECWRATAKNDGREVFSLDSASKALAIECALAAMRRYLMRGHRAALRTYRASCCRPLAVPPAAPHPAPLSPDEELADTVARQKGEEASHEARREGEGNDDR